MHLAFRLDRRAGTGPEGRGARRRHRIRRSFEPGVRTSDPRHGDFQANGVLAAAKKAGKPPRPMAEAVAGALGPEIREALRRDGRGAGLHQLHGQARRCSWPGSRPTAPAPPSPPGPRPRTPARPGSSTTARPTRPSRCMSATCARRSSARPSRASSGFTGARVVRDNHLGDWGTQYGKLIWAYKRHLDEAALAADPIEEFERLYKVGNTAAEADPSAAWRRRGRNW